MITTGATPRLCMAVLLGLGLGLLAYTYSSHTTAIFEFTVHFGPITPAKYHVCISSACNAIMPTRFC